MKKFLSHFNSKIKMNKNKSNLLSKILFSSLFFGISSFVIHDKVYATIESERPACPSSGTVENLEHPAADEQPDCFITPNKVEIKFYEMGFCETDPYDSEQNFDPQKCTTAWSNSSGDSADLAVFVAKGLLGDTVRIKNGTYNYAYMIIDNEWTLNGTYTTTLNGGTTYYTNNADQGTGFIEDVTTDKSKYSDLVIETKYMSGTNNCGEVNFGKGDDGQSVRATLVNNSLVKVIGLGPTSCGSTQGGEPTKMIGVVGLSTPLVMTDSITSYRMEWKIKNLGLGIEVNHDTNQPGWWTIGPVVPIFQFN